MTAINAAVDRVAAYFVTDTSTYDAEKRLTGFTSKVLTIPHIGVALAATGSCATNFEIAYPLRRFATFEDLLANVADEVRELWESGDLRFTGDDHTDRFRLFIAGYSQARNKPELYAISSSDEADGTAFSLINRPGLMSPDLPAEVVSDCLMRGGGDVVATLTDFIDAQRMHRIESLGRYIVGGSAVLTRIDKVGVSQRVVRHWVEDRIGEFIEPVGPEVALPTNVSKLKRDMLAKKAAKGKLRVVA